MQQAWARCFVSDGRGVLVAPGPRGALPMLPGGTVETTDATPEDAQHVIVQRITPYPPSKTCAGTGPPPAGGTHPACSRQGLTGPGPRRTAAQSRVLRSVNRPRVDSISSGPEGDIPH